MPRRLALAAAVALGCGTDNSPAFTTTTTGVTSVAHTSSSSGSTTTSTSTTSSTGGTAEDSAAASNSASTFDMAPPPDLDDPTPAGCKGKIDFVFVISALFTMAGEQDQLVASFPGFLDVLETKFAGFDRHIISVNTDEKWRGLGCEAAENCGNKGNCGPNAMDYVCGSHADTVFKCDRTRGAGLLYNAGPYATNHPCELYGGNRYIIEGETDPDAFACIAQVGTFGDDPPLADTLVAAVSDELNGPGGCNEGFLRDDALLVFVFIMDNEDDESVLSAKKVHDAVVAAKGGDEHAVVGLAIIAQPLEGEPVPGCVYDDGLWPIHLREVIKTFDYHHEGNICADSYDGFFSEAADLVHEACNAFIPQ
ncbi:hypothetical protein OV203_34175 [Nannocystis sp. ILAH1]|uniref:hypothetical protein n=1 Tax=unclassified Nannocystis TaxID=2627009 RepID=UPI002271CA9D|nr:MULTISPECIES: hypothetical protein [unclassified Nannocystis]MCY0992235.1 hypothetical protein [Nannocystis sp. ILAH1]MCY1069176.1 hypothetical protein [Nannocystis sp. RBIL2]